jgi:hypothetical protein
MDYYVMLNRLLRFITFGKYKTHVGKKRKEMEKYIKYAKTLKKENPAMFRLTFLISESLRSVN